MKGGGFLIEQLAGGVFFDAFQSVADVVFREFEDLPGAALPNGDVAKAEGFFLWVSLVPEVVQAVDEKLRGDVRLFLDAEGVDRFVAV